MFGALAIITMRKQNNKASLAQPFRLSTAQKLIKHHLSAIGKVTELCFPKNQ
ncbi:hypothetical protein BIFBRE_05119 [Bifidobacterium breve DSM 20213 = JCM 1192]|uniref:Uncharacterized protein n=1 Tax=Bifidobacterium breve DSM 20213 = JCM 1192 TaxID=518634 RepID=D4BSM7_BIFBR|nr:hypothetical protein BIFBRE_05119 [Bifidobacterium breve DSM 20213 = JCM 1192]